MKVRWNERWFPMIGDEFVVTAIGGGHVTLYSEKSMYVMYVEVLEGTPQLEATVKVVAVDGDTNEVRFSEPLTKTEQVMAEIKWEEVTKEWREGLKIRLWVVRSRVTQKIVSVFRYLEEAKFMVKGEENYYEIMVIN